MKEAGLQKIDSINRILAPAVIFAAVTAWFFQAFIMGSDLFWHLASGRDIWQRGHVPQTDPFSYTFGGQPWANHEWLWDVIYWAIYQLGPNAVAWFTIGLITIVFLLVYFRAYQASGSVFGAGTAVWLAAATSYWYLDIRPHIVTLLMVSIVLVTMNRKWAPWMWPPLIIVWTNLHAGFVFGIGMVGLLVLVRTLEDSWNAKRLMIPWSQWISVAICLVAWLVNPYGWRIAEFQLDYFFHASAYQDLVEWKPPDFGLDPSCYEGSFWWFAIFAFAGIILTGDVLYSSIAVGITALVRAALLRTPSPSKGVWLLTLFFANAVLMRKQKYRYLICLSMVAFLLATNSRRFIPLFAIISTPFVAILVVSARDFLAARIPQLKSPWAGVTATVVAAAIAATMWDHISFKGGLLRQWAMGDVYPEEAIQYLKALGPPPRVLNHYNWGGLIMLKSPGAKLFIDGRANTLYGEDIYLDYVEFCAGRVSAERLRRYEADVALLPISYFSAALEKLQPPWKPLYRGAAVVILAPPGSPFLSQQLPPLNEVLKDSVDSAVNEAIEAFGRNDQQRAREVLEQAVKNVPYSTRAYGLLIRYFAKTGDFNKLDEVAAAAFHDNPRQISSIYLQVAGAYREAGELERALVAYKKGRMKGPFSNREENDRTIKAIEVEIERKKRGF